MTTRSLASKLAKLEGKKSQARIGDIRELLRLLADITLEDPSGFIEMMRVEWMKREKKRDKK
jgi:hypothetical protein